MQVEIISPESKLFNGEATSVKVPGTAGQFEMLNNHAAIISTLSAGKITVKDDKNVSQEFEVTGGVIEMKNNKLIILAD